MNTIVSLMKMDLLKLYSLKKTFILFSLIALLCSASSFSAPIGYFLFMYLAVYGVMAYDEVSKGNYLFGALPVSRVRIVQGKYSFLLGCLVLLSVFIVIINQVVHIFLPAIDQNPMAPAFLFGLLFSSGAVFSAFVVPAAMVLGPNKARIVTIALYMVVFMVIGSAPKVIQDGALDTVSMPSSMTLILLGLLILLISYLACCAIYAKKEYRD